MGPERDGTREGHEERREAHVAVGERFMGEAKGGGALTKVVRSNGEG
jgi:hypothetical protein